MPYRELHGRRSAGRNSENCRCGNLKRVKKTGIKIGLRLRRRIAGERCSQVAEAGDENTTECGIQPSREVERMIESSSGAVNHEQRETLSNRGVLNCATLRMKY